MAAEETASTTQTCPSCGAAIDTRAAEPLARVACPQCGESIRVERAFDNFLILETLGIGGMGTVYKARDTLLDREVALKLLRDDLGTEFDQAARLQQEARVAASVNHPNVIQVFSSGTDHGKFYLVMELVDRGSLDDLMEEQKRLPEDLVLQTGIQVAKGLWAACAKGLIHRDVKPANILFSDEHTAKIGDFGLAGVAAEKYGDEIWGTPYYVAPERLKNEPEDFRSDIYSLGATLFHAVSGRAPIEGETNSAIALRELKEKPIDLRKAMPEVSAEGARVLQRMIAPDPAERFRSYAELVEALEQAHGWLTGEGEFVAKKSKARWVAGAVMLGVALIAVGGWAYVSHQRAQRTVDDVSARAEQVMALAPLEAQANEARHQILQGHHNVAKASFAKIAQAAKGRQPLYDWARLQQGLAALIARENGEAKQAFQEVQNAGSTGFTREDAGLAQFFTDAARRLTAGGSAAVASVPHGANGPEMFELFLAGMKDMAQGDAPGAMPLLERFVAAKPEGKSSWMAEYKPLAEKYLDDCRLYVAWKNENQSGLNAAARLEKVRAVKAQLKVRSSTVSDEINGTEKRLATEASREGKPAPLAPAGRAETQVSPAAEPISQNRRQWLMQWKSQLVSDLNASHYAGPITDVNGVQYTGITAANDSTVKMKLAYGEAEVPWAKLPPKTLLAISRTFARPDAPDLADREWLAAVYANETGNADDAKQLADAAAKLKPEYQRRIPFLFPR